MVHDWVRVSSRKETMMNKRKDLPKSSRKPKRRSNEHESSALPGWPGYRTREGRSGYDPIDTRTEAAHTAGTLLQKLFTGQVKNPLYLFLLAVVGLVLLTPLVLGISEAMKGNQLPWNAWIFLLITGIAGLVILINFLRNLLRRIRR